MRSRSLPSLGQAGFLDLADDPAHRALLSNFFVTAAYRFDRALNVDVLAAAFSHVVSEHDALQIGFSRDSEGAWSQFIAPPSDTGAPTLVPGYEPLEDAVVDLANPWAAFDRGAGNLARLTVVDSAQGTALVASLDHMVVDGHSMKMFLTEIEEAYSALVDGRRPHPAKQGMTWFEWVSRQRDALTPEAIVPVMDFWRGSLGADVTVVGNPLDGFTAAVPMSAPHNVIRCQLDPLRSRLIAQQARSVGVSLFTLLGSAVSLTLARHSERSDVTLKTSVANRWRAADKLVVGPLAHDIFIRLPIRAQDTHVEAIEVFDRGFRAALAHSRLPDVAVWTQLWPDTWDFIANQNVVYFSMSEPASERELDLGGSKGREIELPPIACAPGIEWTVERSRSGDLCGRIRYQSGNYHGDYLAGLIDEAFETCLREAL